MALAEAHDGSLTATRCDVSDKRRGTSIPATLAVTALDPIGRSARLTVPVTVMIGLLRGVNVGGANRLAMADLRAMCADCGFERVSTYIQSGNVVFDADVSADEAERRLESALDAHMGKPIDVTIRTADELAAVVADNPFLARTDDIATLHVAFTIGDGDGDAALAIDDLAPFAPEEAIAADRHVYFLLPGGVGRSKLLEALGRQGRPAGTMRNWRTVTKLAAIAAETA